MIKLNWVMHRMCLILTYRLDHSLTRIPFATKYSFHARPCGRPLPSHKFQDLPNGESWTSVLTSSAKHLFSEAAASRCSQCAGAIAERRRAMQVIAACSQNPAGSQHISMGVFVRIFMSVRFGLRCWPQDPPGKKQPPRVRCLR